MKFQNAYQKKLIDILNLFAVADPTHIRNRQYYKWRNFNCPFGQALSYVAENSKGKPIAHYSVLPQKLTFKDRTYTAGFSQQAVVHPDYRDLKTICDLISFTLEKARDYGFDFVYGFPNNNFYFVQEKVMNWQQINRFRAKLYKIDDLFKRREIALDKLNNSIKQVDNIEEIVSFISNEKNQFIKLSANEDYIKWRYTENPENYYPIFIEKSSNSYIVLKIYNDIDNVVGHIIEVEASHNKNYRMLFEKALMFFKEMGINNLVIWNYDDLEQYFEGLEYEETFMTNFYSKNLLLSEDEFEKVKNINNWRLQMHYSDAF